MAKCVYCDNDISGECHLMHDDCVRDLESLLRESDEMILVLKTQVFRLTIENMRLASEKQTERLGKTTYH